MQMIKSKGQIFLGALGLIWLCSAAALAELPKNPLLQEAFLAAEREDHFTAAALVAPLQNSAVNTLFQWHKLRDGAGEYGEYIQFLSAHPNWPGLRRMRREGEVVIPANADPISVLAFFESEPPQTLPGAQALAGAYRLLGREEEAREVIITAWRSFSLDLHEQRDVLRSWSDVLEGQHWARADEAIWTGRLTEAERLLPLLSAGERRLAEARIALRRREEEVNPLINRIPRNLQDDPGLAYDRFLWRYRAGLTESAIDLMLSRSTSGASLGRPEIWGERRRILARRAMRNGNHRTAYRIAANHFMTEGYPPADMEWFAGYIALRKLGDTDLATRHFQRFLSFVDSPISVSRGHYWLGRAAEAAGNTQAAGQAYSTAAQYQTTFYGQLAAERSAAAVNMSIMGSSEDVNWRRSSFIRSDILPFANLAHQSGDWISTELFLTRIALDLKDPEEIAALAQYAIDQYGRADTAVRLSKQAAQEGQIFPVTAYPVTALANFQSRVSPELVKSLARQESELNPKAESHAGALGLMQLMPQTASQVARRMGLTYSRNRLTEDWRYNASIGIRYLEGLMADFDGSIVLSAASYNAGPSRVRNWMRSYGDPREMSPDQVLDWIENIPFRETRNYVQRVIEGLHVYRMRISGEVVPFQISADLIRG